MSFYKFLYSIDIAETPLENSIKCLINSRLFTSILSGTKFIPGHIMITDSSGKELHEHNITNPKLYLFELLQEIKSVLDIKYQKNVYPPIMKLIKDIENIFHKEKINIFLPTEINEEEKKEIINIVTNLLKIKYQVLTSLRSSNLFCDDEKNINVSYSDAPFAQQKSGQKRKRQSLITECFPNKKK